MRPLIPIGTVAEKSIVWRAAGTNSMIWPISTAKPMSSIRSASSSTRKCTPEKSSVPRRRWSSTRPGVPAITWAPARIPSIWRSMESPP